jgi:hypothetical protein
MSSMFTPNKGIEQPASGDYVNAWAVPLNNDWAIIDKALGGTTSISVNSVPAGTVALTLSQYQPIDIVFTGALSANLNYQIPAGVGGIWTINNATSGSFTLQFSIASGNVLNLAPGRTFIVSDGVNVGLASANIVISFSQILGQVSNGQVPVGAVTQYQGNFSLSSIGGQLNAPSQLNGIVPNGNLPNIGNMPGVTIAADPGTIPSGSPGQMFLYY